jgi:hypothetical protein
MKIYSINFFITLCRNHKRSSIWSGINFTARSMAPSLLTNNLIIAESCLDNDEKSENEVEDMTVINRKSQVMF